MPEKPEIGAACNGCGLCCKLHVCSTGSYVLGLAEAYGDRAPGPCPALTEEDGRFSCGLVRRPKDYIDSPRGAMVLREAVKLVIGAGAGCDEIGDEPEASADPKLEAMQNAYVQKTGRAAIIRAKRMVIDGE